MDNNKRPDSMQRITTPELAEAFINEQVYKLKPFRSFIFSTDSPGCDSVMAVVCNTLTV